MIEESVTLFKAVASVGNFRQKYGLQPEVEGEDEFHEQIGEARAAFAASKKLMFVSSAAHCLYEMTGKEQVSDATEWVKDKHDKIPKTLLDELSKLVKRKGMAKTEDTEAKKL